MSGRLQAAPSLMMSFAERTGLTTDRRPRRYLWTDAFAVCNFLGLERAIGDRQYRDLAVRGRRRTPSDNSIGTIHNNDFRNRHRLPIILVRGVLFGCVFFFLVLLMTDKTIMTTAAGSPVADN